MKTSLINCFFALLVICCVSGCATVALAPGDRDRQAKAFSPPAGKAHIYVYRRVLVSSDGVLWQVGLDGGNVAGIAPGTFRLFVVEPGKRTVTASAQENQAILTIDAEAGHNYFIRVSPTWGLVQARVSVTIVDEHDGKESVKKCRLAEL